MRQFVAAGTNAYETVGDRRVKGSQTAYLDSKVPTGFLLKFFKISPITRCSSLECVEEVGMFICVLLLC